MSEVKPYKLPEEKTSIVSDSMAVRITPDTDIVTLRHNVMGCINFNLPRTLEKQPSFSSFSSPEGANVNSRW